MSERQAAAPTVSVVTPSFNQGEFLEATIVSVLSQAGDFFLDYLVMDGGSTDDSVAIIEKYDRLLREGGWPAACRGITFRWRSGRDGGQADAVNQGFARATGEILGWLNSDDTYLPGAIARAVAHFAHDPECVMLYGNAYYTDRAGAVTGSYPSEPFRFGRLAQKCFICQPAVFLRAAALRETGPLDAGIHTCMDYELWIRMGRRFDGRIAFLEDYLATSRMYADNKTTAQRDRVVRENVMVLERHFGYVDGENLASCFYDIVFDAQGSPLRERLARLRRRSFAFACLLNVRTFCSFARYLAGNLPRLLRRRREQP